jgi:hypothetical protein
LSVSTALLIAWGALTAADVRYGWSHARPGAIIAAGLIHDT